MLVMLRLARNDLSWAAIEQLEYPWFFDACLVKELEGWRTRRTLSGIMRTSTSILTKKQQIVIKDPGSVT